MNIIIILPAGCNASVKALIYLLFHYIIHRMELQMEKVIVTVEVNGISNEMRDVYEAFLKEKKIAKKEHRLAIDDILKDMDERKIKELKERLRNYKFMPGSEMTGFI